MDKWIRERVDVYLRHGGKIARRRMVKRLLNALNDIRQHEQGVRLPPQIGRGHIHRFYVRHEHLSPATVADYYRAFCLLWAMLGREGIPPRPH